MAGQRQDGWATDSGTAVSDMRGKEFLFATRVAGGLDICGAAGKVAGVISEGRNIGYHTSINVGGHPLKVIAGAAIAVGDAIQSNASGQAITATSTTNNWGTARNSTAGAGEYVEIDKA